MQYGEKEHRKFGKNSYDSFILAGDIGGTNTNLGIFGIKNKSPALLISYNFNTKKLKNLEFAVNCALSDIQENRNIRITKACLAAAGVLSEKSDYVATQNLPWDISKKMLLGKTKLKGIFLINDFEAIGYGINMLAKKDIVPIKKAQKVPKAPILVTGAGTGLGKTTLVYSKQYKAYFPIPSEAGHSDFAAQNQEELDLINFIKKDNKIEQGISYEQVLSGQGLSNIYMFLRKSKRFGETKCTKEIGKSNYKPELISKYRKTDKTCKATFNIFKVIYARFARNCALDCLAFGGVYIAGGIAPKNRDIFGREFINEFENNYKMRGVLKKIPVYLVINQNAGLIGAGFAGTKILK